MHFEFEQIGSRKKGYFMAKTGSIKAGIITYRQESDTILIVEHTKVENSFQDQKVGIKLLMHLVNYARENNYELKPECSFAKKIFQIKPNIQDVLYKYP